MLGLEEHVHLVLVVNPHLLHDEELFWCHLELVHILHSRRYLLVREWHCLETTHGRHSWHHSREHHRGHAKHLRRNLLLLLLLSMLLSQIVQSCNLRLSLMLWRHLSLFNLRWHRVIRRLLQRLFRWLLHFLRSLLWFLRC